jgi:hypothetical protein
VATGVDASKLAPDKLRLALRRGYFLFVGVRIKSTTAQVTKAMRNIAAMPKKM